MLEETGTAEIGWGSLRLARGRYRQRRHVSAARLDHGILIGRYDRCGIAVNDANDVSRVHALLVKIGGDLWAIDTASTNGLWRGHMAVQAEILKDVETLRLGHVATLSWERYKHPEA
jgi:pSer/pThr/pTyr-binding forkhead associated (FHA) protein